MVPGQAHTERMPDLILPGNLSALFGELSLLVPCTALFLAARRLTVLQVRHHRFYFNAALVCAVTLWAGPVNGIAGSLVASLLEARFFLPDRGARLAALKSGASLAIAAAAAAAILAISPSIPDIVMPVGQLCIAAWRHAVPALLTFVAAYGIGMLVADNVFPSGKRRRHAPYRIRAGITLAGFAPLAAAIPLGPALGAWALLPLLAVLAAIGFLIRHTSEISKLRRQLSVSQAMGLASLADAATAEPTALLYRFLHLSQNLVHSERSLVWMINDSNDEIIPAVGLPDMGEFAGIRTRLGEGLIGSAADRTRPIIVSDAARTLRRGENEPAADSWLLYPIVSQKRVMGVAHWTRPAGNPFTAEDAAQLEGLVPQVGVAVESLRARNKMRELASTDGLTGLLNHRRVGEMLRDEMRRSERYNRPLSVLMMDVDSFKSFNDTYGHVVGDQLLKSVSQLLRAGVRTVDKVGRYGGEEFIIVMPETHKDDAYLLAERIRSTVEQQAFVVVAGEEIHRTISVGVASYPEDGLNPQEVVERADEALYRAKNNGKNCVIWA